MGNELKLFTEGTIQDGQGREFTRLMGGFGDGKPMFLLWQAGELLGQETNLVTKNFNNNLKNFEENIDYIDLKSLTNDIRKIKSIDITDFLKSIGITHHKYGRANQWLAFSFSGMMKLVKIATTKESWDIYNNFLEDYFKTKAENKIMKKTLEEEKEFLIERKKFILGSMFMEQDDIKRMDYFKENEQLSNRIKEIEVVISNKELKKKIEEDLGEGLAIIDRFSNSDGLIDIGVFSKILSVEDMGRNNMFKWLRDNKFLMKGNIPYQQYMDYFKVLQIPNKYTGEMNNKTVLKFKGVKYIVKKLIDDGKILPKPLEELVEELNANKVS